MSFAAQNIVDPGAHHMAVNRMDFRNLYTIGIITGIEDVELNACELNGFSCNELLCTRRHSWLRRGTKHLCQTANNGVDAATLLPTGNGMLWFLKKIAKAGCVYEEFISYEINRKTGG